MKKFILGFILGSLVYGALSFALSSETLTDLSEDSVPVLNNIIRELRFEITDIKKRLDAGGL